MSHTKDDLRELQSKPLEEKIQISTARIIEWYESWDGQVYISNSGGVDSTVLSWLVHRIYPDVIDAYCDTPMVKEEELNRLMDIIEGYDESLIKERPPFEVIVDNTFAEKASK